MARTLKMLMGLFGLGCTLIGFVHLVGGVELTVPWLGVSTAAVDSRDRFNSAIFMGYGLSWLWMYRQPRFNVPLIRFLSIIFFVGGLGRAPSWLTVGRPHWFQIILMIVELGLPIIFLVLIRDSNKLNEGSAEAGT